MFLRYINHKYVKFPILFIVLFSGCKDSPIAPTSQRKIEFNLFTDQNFSQETNTIIFQPSISAGNVVLWDSTFQSMKIKDIPAEVNKIKFQKVILNNTADLKVGFKYTIENVGISWYYEQAVPTEALKVVKFNFR